MIKNLQKPLRRGASDGSPLVVQVGAWPALFDNGPEPPDKPAFLAACLPLMNLLVSSALEIEGGRVGLCNGKPVLELAFRTGGRWRVEFVENRDRPMFLSFPNQALEYHADEASLRRMLENSVNVFRQTASHPLDHQGQIAALELAGRALLDWLHARKKGITL